MQKTLQVDSIFGKWANKTWTHTCKRPLLSLAGCPEVSLDIELPQYTDTCSIDMLSQENIKTYTSLCVLKLINHDAYMSNACLTADQLYGGRGSFTRLDFMFDMHLYFDFGSRDLLLLADPNLVKRVIKLLYLQCSLKPLNYPSK